MSDFDLTLDASTVQEFQNAADRNLTAPTSIDENPTFAAGKEPGLGSWTEVVRVRDTDMTTTKSDPNNSNKFNFVLQLEILGTDHNGYQTNAGRVHYQYFFIDKQCLASSNPKDSGPYKRRIATVNSLLAAVGVDLSAGVLSYKQLFTADKPLIGQQVAAVFRKYRNKKTGETGVDIDGFVLLK